MILVSACLLGVNCRYNGASTQMDNLMELAARGEVIPVCPEQLGGLPTPRDPCEIRLGTGADVLDGKCRVITNTCTDVTDNFLRGAQETLKIANTFRVKKAVLKARSPSCGSGKIHDGSFSGTMIDGNGVTADLLMRNYVEVFTELTFNGEEF